NFRRSPDRPACFEAAVARHIEIEQHQIVMARPQLALRLFARAGFGDFIAFARQRHFHDPANLWIVVHDQNSSQTHSLSSAAGSSTENTAPSPGAFSTRIVPRCDSIT